MRRIYLTVILTLLKAFDPLLTLSYLLKLVYLSALVETL